jgi:hypothetical protein
MSFVLYSRLDESNLDATIQEQITYFSAHSLPFEWKPNNCARELHAKS